MEDFEEIDRLLKLVAFSPATGHNEEEWAAYAALTEIGWSAQMIDLETQRIRREHPERVRTE